MESGFTAPPIGRTLSGRRQGVLVFDSGIGGMGVVRALHAARPELHIDYLADTALFPYGEQPDESLTQRIVSLLAKACEHLQPDLLIVACNTASTIALPSLREALDIPVVGCVPPIRWAGRVSQTRTIGLLSTSATARRPYIAQLHKQFAPDCRLLTHGARNLADLAEKAFLGHPVPEADIRYELEQLFAQPFGQDIDTIGLGCTHYTFLMPAFIQVARQAVTWLDPAPAVARQVVLLLESFASSEDTDLETDRPPRLLVTGEPPDGPKLDEAIRHLGFQNREHFSSPSLPGHGC